MAKTYSQLQKQIQKLQAEAEGLRQREVGGVIDRIKVAIAHYGLTAAHLGFSGIAKAAGKAKTPKAGAKGAAFSDGQGNVWSGRGPRPRWLKAALANGRAFDEFKVRSSQPGARSAAKRPSAKTAAKKRAPSTKNYSDGTGNSWGGRGPTPRWLKDALASGKELKDYLQ